MDLVHRYGESCRSNSHADSGRLYSQIVRALEGPGDDEERPPGPEAERALERIGQL